MRRGLTQIPKLLVIVSSFQGWFVTAAPRRRTPPTFVAAPFVSPECARMLDPEVLRATTTVAGRLTSAEYDRIFRVPVVRREILEFCRTVFSVAGAPTDESIAACFAGLWRRIPEVMAPTFAATLGWTDADILSAWLDFREAINGVAVEPGEYRPLKKIIIDEGISISRHVRSVSPHLISLVIAVPHDGDEILSFLARTYPSSPMKADGWVNARLRMLWVQLFGVDRSGKFVRTKDAWNIKHEHSALARRRLIDEWRILLVTLNRNRTAPVTRQISRARQVRGLTETD